MEPNNRPIGVFDSGVGGLTVLEHLRTLMPNEHFLYIADLAHVPFGSKSLSEIWDINDQLFDFLIDCGTKMIVIACNTSSAVALEHDKGKYTLPIIDMLTPSLNGVILQPNDRITLLATERTIKSKSYEKRIRESFPNIQIKAVTCPTLVPLIEADILNEHELDRHLKLYLKGSENDYILLGCSHYALIIKKILAITHNPDRIINPAIAVANEAKQQLINNKIENIDNLDNLDNNVTYYVTGDHQLAFQKKVFQLLGWQIPEPKRLELTREKKLCLN